MISGTVSAAGDSNSFTANAHLPDNAKPTCVADVASWFRGGKITPNGWVNPANSLDPIFADFKNNTRCDFYKWASQMFLWLTSEVGKNHVFNTSPTFYNISVEQNGKRYFLPGDGSPLRMAVFREQVNEETELGQAGGGDVLLSQKNSLVYFSSHANDVYALYTTGRKKAGSTLPTHFPSTPAEITAITKFAAAYGYPIPAPEAMAIELKTSWVGAMTVADKSGYVLTRAVVPVFDHKSIDPDTGEQQWSIIGNQEKTLALVGMHIVGTVNGHPEMVWSTFEHVSNAPDNTYTYTTTEGKTATKSYDSSGVWNFIRSGADAPTSLTANAQVSTYMGEGAQCKRANPDDQNSECIVNVNKAEIAPIDILRVDPWGNDHSAPASSTVVANNTDLVSINYSVLSQLKNGDIRGNYAQTGGVWTSEGQIPPDGNSTDLRGSLNLANTTMETFYQFHNPAKDAFNPKNCFGCHGSSETDATGVSHIYGELQALPRK